MLFTAVVFFHVIVAITLILVVLLQSSKGEALSGSAFGGGGGGGASFGQTRESGLSKATKWLALLFMLTCTGLTYLGAQSNPTIQAGEVDPNARSVVSEQMQRELAEQQAAASQQVGDGSDAPLDLDSLVQVAPSGDTGSIAPDSQ